MYPYFRPIEENDGPEVRIEGRNVIMAGSNNYLGLTADPRVKEAAKKAIDQFGTGCSGSRYLTGTISLHIELEHRLAEYLGTESVLLFSTGYQTALGVIAALVSKGDYVISDKENHACIISGCLLAKGGFAEFVRYKHNDMEDLERVLRKIPADAGKLIVTDGVFSVSGEFVDLPNLLDVAEKYGARVMVDDAHATGVVGIGGRGTASHFGVVERTDLTMGTFSKSLASLGGFVAGPERVLNYLKHHSPALIFSASPTPASVAAALASLEIMQQEPWRIERLIANADKMRSGFAAMGLNVIDSRTGIVPVVIGEVELTLLFWRKLYDKGVFVNAFVPPGVPPTLSMLRTSYMATHEDHHLDTLLSVFHDVALELGVINK
ncbi:MAG: pyridoxal phosphate-dependent aminotransferase family protein [bacterium]|nr:pyridoxal phosphate-dependent aminotransferase family protein [bacterium]